jgi:hypothetical protein
VSQSENELLTRCRESNMSLLLSVSIVTFPDNSAFDDSSLAFDDSSLAFDDSSLAFDDWSLAFDDWSLLTFSDNAAFDDRRLVFEDWSSWISFPYPSIFPSNSWRSKLTAMSCGAGAGGAGLTSVGRRSNS